MKTVFIRALEAKDKPPALLQGVARDGPATGAMRYDADPSIFAAIPCSPFAYWGGRAVLDTFRLLLPLESRKRVARRGVNSNDDFRFLRLAWETEAEGIGQRWQLHVKGGAFSRFYADPHMLLNWGRSGAELKAPRVTTRVYKSAIVPSEQSYFRPGLTWPRRTQGGLSLRALPTGCIFADKGPAAFVEDDDPESLLALLALTNSRAFSALVELQMAFGSYEVGVIQRTPVPDLTPEDEETLAAWARRAWSLKRSLDTITDNSHAFHLPALLQTDGGTLVSRATTWATHVAAVESELADIQAEIDDYCFTLYGIEGEDRRQIEEGFGPASVEEADDSEDEDSDETEEVEADLPTLSASLVSWALGAAFGRFDVRLAQDQLEAPPEPEPFDPLPLSSPGMLQGEDVLPLLAPPSGYPLAFPADGILTDDPGHPSDLLARIEEVFASVLGEDADAFLDEAAACLDPRGHDLRTYLRKNFFEFHMKRYSKSRRKAPLFWQLATPSGSYALWLYYPRLTKDTFFRILNDLVGPKVQHEEAKFTRLTQEAGPEPSRSERKALDEQETLLEELRAFREEVFRVAPLWEPDSNDGVLVNASLLWRLFPHHKNWQKECRACFQKLEQGDYDWAQLAMHLWPERVVQKCTEDRSLAIAHGLEEEFWREDDGTWHSRRSTEGELQTLTRERTSASVQSALEGLLGAPGVGRGGRNARNSR